MFKTQTNYTKKVFDDFAKFIVCKNPLVTTIIICGVIIFISSIFMFALSFVLAGILYALSGIFFLNFGFLLKFSIIFFNKKNIDKKEIFNFDTKKMKVVTFDKTDREISNISLNYKDFFKTQKNLNYGYIFVNKVTIYIINKNNFKNEKDFFYILNTISKNIEKKKVQKRSEKSKRKNQCKKKKGKAE